MKTHVAIIAALPREIASLVRGVAADPVLKVRGIFLYRMPGAVVVAAGMGSARVTLAVEAALAAAPVQALLSVGVAGACDPALAVGAIVRAGVVVDARTGERFEDSQFRQVLVTGAEIASVAEKRRLFAAYGASAVDMEAATVARLARARGLEFGAIKAISDASEFELQELGRFTTKDGQFREAAFAAYVVVRPWMWSKTIELARNSALALRALETALRPIVEGD
jgi:adenosylhomocysteine nucleosidase